MARLRRFDCILLPFLPQVLPLLFVCRANEGLIMGNLESTERGPSTSAHSPSYVPEPVVPRRVYPRLLALSSSWHLSFHTADISMLSPLSTHQCWTHNATIRQARSNAWRSSTIRILGATREYFSVTHIAYTVLTKNLSPAIDDCALLWICELPAGIPTPAHNGLTDHRLFSCATPGTPELREPEHVCPRTSAIPVGYVSAP